MKSWYHQADMDQLNDKDMASQHLDRHHGSSAGLEYDAAVTLPPCTILFADSVVDCIHNLLLIGNEGSESFNQIIGRLGFIYKAGRNSFERLNPFNQIIGNSFKRFKRLYH